MALSHMIAIQHLKVWLTGQGGWKNLQGRYYLDMLDNSISILFIDIYDLYLYPLGARSQMGSFSGCSHLRQKIMPFGA